MKYIILGLILIMLSSCKIQYKKETEKRALSLKKEYYTNQDIEYILFGEPQL